MELNGKRCGVEPFSITQARVKINFDANIIVNILQEELSRLLRKKRGLVELASPNKGQYDMRICGRFTQIDEGSRILRYLLTFFAGKTIVEVEGSFFIGDTHKEDLYAISKQAIGLFGGNSQSLLMASTRIIARKLSKQILKALKEQ